MNINEINNSQVTINNYNVAPGTVNGAAETSTTPSIGPAISNETTFGDLLRILRRYPEAMVAAQTEMKARRNEEKLAKLRRILGEEAEEVCVQGMGANNPEENKQNRRPGAIRLRATGVLLTRVMVGANASLEVYTNAYAIYDNGDRKTVVWIPGCTRLTYHFTPLRENEKDYMSEHAEIGEELIMDFPWYNAIVVVGENQIEVNLGNPKSDGNESDLNDKMMYERIAAKRWVGGAHFDDPEEAYLRKEAREERLALLTERQREVYELYFEQDYTLREIADMLGISFRGVAYRVEGMLGVLRKNK